LYKLKKIFPHGGNTLLGYKYIDKNIREYVFDLSVLKKWNRKDAQQKILATQKKITTFSVDTASFLIIDLHNLKKLMTLITYDTITDAFLNNKLDNYIDKVNKDLDNKGWAYISSEGIDTESEFDGDGSYIVE